MQPSLHLAAYAKNWSPDPETPAKINVEGSRNVFEIARELNINRVVHTSSIVTFGPTLPGVVGNEDMPRVTQKYFTAYEETKSEVEAYALQLAKDGMPNRDRQSDPSLWSRETHRREFGHENAPPTLARSVSNFA